jgi:hypothetical protein
MVANRFASRFVLAGLVLALALTAVMVLAIGLSLAQGPKPGTTGEVPRSNIDGWELNQASASPRDGAFDLGPANLKSGFTQPNNASGGAPRPAGMISYQGQLLRNGIPVDGSVLMTFTLYTSPSGNTAWWQEQQTVQVDDGLFNVDLGVVEPLSSVSPYFQNQPWLGVQPEGAAELTPRQPLGAVGYAYNVMPGATTIDTDDGSAAYVYSFFVSSVNHPAIYGSKK